MNLKTLAAAFAVGLLTAGSAAYAQDKGTIGIAMPTKSSARWIADGDNIVKTLAGQGLQDRSSVRRQRHSQPARAG